MANKGLGGLILFVIFTCVGLVFIILSSIELANQAEGTCKVMHRSIRQVFSNGQCGSIGECWVASRGFALSWQGGTYYMSLDYDGRETEQESQVDYNNTVMDSVITCFFDKRYIADHGPAESNESKLTSNYISLVVGIVMALPGVAVLIGLGVYGVKQSCGACCTSNAAVAAGPPVAAAPLQQVHVNALPAAAGDALGDGDDRKP